MKSIFRYLYNKVVHRKKVRFKYSTSIGRNSSFEGNNIIHQNTLFGGSLGRCSYIGANSNICAKIGRYTSIGSNCYTIQGIHPYTYPYVSTSPVFFSLHKQCGVTYAKEQAFDESKFIDDKKNISVEIGNDCWINACVKIVSGIRISDGAIVLAGSVVTKNVPPYAIVGGVPAKIIKYRYSQEDIDFLLKFKWWEKDVNWLKDNWMLFLNISELKKKAYSENESI